MSAKMTNQDCRDYLWKLLAYGILFSQLNMTDGGSVTWYEPPPVVTTSNHLLVLTADSRQILEGSTNVPLHWNFSLTEDANPITLMTVTLNLNDVNIATIVPTTGQVGLEPSFQGRYNISWIPQVATVTIFNVSAEDNGEFGCEVATLEGASSIVWKRKVTVEVVDPAVITHISGNQTVNETDVVTLICLAEGMPTPSISWTRISDNSSVFFPLTITGKQDEGGYRCIAENGIGKPASQAVYIVVENYHPIDANLRTSFAGNSVVVNTSFNITCSAQANPPAMYKFYKDQVNFVNDTTGSDVSVITTSVSERRKQVNYSCTPFNYFGNGLTDGLTLTALYQPDDVHLTKNATDKVCAGIIINFTCSAEANPAVHTYLLYENDTVIYNMLLGTVTKTMKNAGLFVFRCEANNSIQDTGRSSDAIVTVLGRIEQAENKIAEEGTDIEVYCNVTGNSDSTVIWRNLKTGEISEGNPLNITNITRAQAGEYKCAANNTCGVDSTTVNIDVHYPPAITSEDHTIPVSEGSPASVSCPVLGNPHPTITWYKGNETSPTTMINTSNILKFPETVLDDDGSYTCFAENFLGNVTVTVQLRVGKPIQTTVTTSPKPTTKVSTQVVESTISATVTIDKSCDERLHVEKRFPSLACERVRHLGCLFAQAVASRCGSVIVDFEMKFNQSAVVSEVLNVLKTAAKEDNFNGFKVDPTSIEQVFPSPTGTPGTKAAEECKCSCNDVIWASVVGFLVFIIIGLILYIVWLHKKGTAAKQRRYEGERGVYDNEMALDDLQPSSHIPSKSTQSRSEYMSITEATRDDKEAQRVAQSTDYAPLHPSTRYWEVEKQHVTIEKIIGKGAFGQVAKGTVTGLQGKPGKTIVAVKMIKYNSPESDRKDLLTELDTMKQLKPHPHVIKLLGCVTETEPLMVIIEYVPYGDLLGYLRKSRGLNDTYYKDPDIKPQTSLTSQQLMKFAWQIADGMNYLSSKSIIHRDLAARNVLVGERETCKVTDFGMARDVQQDNIYEKKTKGRLPVKWTAYEALLYGTYTTKSDIWSYGVVLYEIFTTGGSPYPRVNGKRIASLLQEGYRMPKPQHVDDKLYEIMLKCWQNDPDVRPTFSELKNQLKDMENQHKRLINLKMYDHKQLYANVEDLVV